MDGSTGRQENFFHNVVQSGGGALLAGNSINTGGGDVIFGRNLQHILAGRCLYSGASADHTRYKERERRPQAALQVTTPIRPFDPSPTMCDGLCFTRRFGSNYMIR
jgi:hypothetical protein